MIHLIQAHPAIATMVAYYILSAGVDSLPDPTAQSSQFYRWFFGFAHTLAGNLKTAFASKLPPAPKQP